MASLLMRASSFGSPKPAIPPLAAPTTFNEGVVTRPLPPEVDAQNTPLPDPNNVLRGLAIVPVDLGPPNNATPGQTGQFGRGSYIVNAVADCSGCHSNPARNRTSPVHAVNTAQYLSGGQVFVTPPPLQPLLRTTRAMSENLVGQARGFFNGTDQSVTPARPVDFTTFLRLITQGVHADDPLPPTGLQRPLGFPMPYAAFRKMTLDDLEAVYTYLNEVAGSSAAPSGPANDKVTQDPSIYCAANSDCVVGSCNMTAHECVGAPCNPSNNVPTTNTDCPVCQQCVSGACVAPDVSDAGTPGSLCIARGL